VPWRLDQAGVYEAQLAIDVGHDRPTLRTITDDRATWQLRHLVSDVTKVQVKPDHKQEAINARFLSDQIVAVFDAALSHQFDPVSSLLILRDGARLDASRRALKQSCPAARSRIPNHNARIDVVEVTSSL